MIRLSKIVKEGEEPKRFSNEVKKHFLEIVSTYNKYQEMMDRKSDITEVAETLGGITDAARELAVNEADDWFDAHTVKRNMNELTKLGKSFDQVAVEAKNLDQRLHGLYEDMGHILSRYYKIGEISEEQMRERLGLREDGKLQGGEKDPCWKGYEMIGMKPGKGGAQVPNCVPKNESVIKEEVKDWDVVYNVFVKFLKANTKELEKRVLSKDEDATKKAIKSIISGLTNAQRSLKLESVNEAIGNDKAMLALVDMLSNSMEHYASANEFVNITSKIPGFANYKSELKDVFAKYYKVDARQRNDWNTKEWLKWLKQWPLEESKTNCVECGKVNEGKYDSDLDKVETAVKNATSFMNVGSELKKAGIKYDFSTSMMPMYMIKVSGNTIAIVNKKYAADAERTVNDIAIGLLENKKFNKSLTEAAYGYKDSTASYIDKHKEEFKAAEKMNKGNEQSFYDSLSTLEEKLGHPKYMIFLSNALRGYKVDMYKDPKIKNQQEAEEALFLLSK
jgi:hypothetical protein